MGGLEAAVLSKVPAYEYLKQAGMSVLGVSESAEHPVVLAELGGAWRIGLQTDVVGKGLVAVFVPNAPKPSVGRGLPHRRRSGARRQASRSRRQWGR